MKLKGRRKSSNVIDTRKMSKRAKKSTAKSSEKAYKDSLKSKPKQPYKRMGDKAGLSGMETESDKRKKRIFSKKIERNQTFQKRK